MAMNTSTEKHLCDEGYGSTHRVATTVCIMPYYTKWDLNRIYRSEKI